MRRIPGYKLTNWFKKKSLGFPLKGPKRFYRNRDFLALASAIEYLEGDRAFPNDDAIESSTDSLEMYLECDLPRWSETEISPARVILFAKPYLRLQAHSAMTKALDNFVTTLKIGHLWTIHRWRKLIDYEQ